jgi:REP element-mobilizing transposase RayT
VIIVTPSKKDHSYEDEKYFLVLNPKEGRNKNFLRESLRVIKNLIEYNENLDTLHE